MITHKNKVIKIAEYLIEHEELRKDKIEELIGKDDMNSVSLTMIDF
jgi:hypothetical protein